MVTSLVVLLILLILRLLFILSGKVVWSAIILRSYFHVFFTFILLTKHKK